MSEVAEIIGDNVEEALDGIVEVVEVFRTNPVALAAAGTIGVIAGVAGGYFLAQKLLEQKYELRIEEEMEAAKQFYANLHKVDDSGRSMTPQEVLAQSEGGEEALEALRGYQGVKPIIDEPVLEGEPHDDIVDEEHIQKMERNLLRDRADKENAEKPERVNVFRDDTFDLEEEIQHRSDDKPYIITHDEYFAAEKDYDTQSLTYYELDDTLVDSQDKPIEKTDQMVGDDHLVRFGSGSKDTNIVYVRNDRLEIDFEIVRSTGSYLEEVLGIPDEDPGSLKHSDQRDRRRSFQRGDG